MKLRRTGPTGAAPATRHDALGLLRNRTGGASDRHRVRGSGRRTRAPDEVGGHDTDSRADRRGARTDETDAGRGPTGAAHAGVRSVRRCERARSRRVHSNSELVTRPPNPRTQRSSEIRDAEPRVQRCGRSQDLGARAARLSPVCPKPVEVKQMLGGAPGGLYSIGRQTGGSGMPKLEAERLSFFWIGLDALLVKNSSCSRSF